MLGIILEMRTPGFGIPGALGVTSLALFFWGHWLVQLAGWEELLLGVAGIVLLAARGVRHPRLRHRRRARHRGHASPASC